MNKQLGKLLLIHDSRERRSAGDLEEVKRNRETK